MTPIEQIRAAIERIAAGTYCKLGHGAGVMMQIDYSGIRSEAESALALLDQLPQWQPIDTAPRDGTLIILWLFEYKIPVIGAWYSFQNHGVSSCTCADGWRENGGFHRRVMHKGKFEKEATYTHWMPLPTPPTEASKTDVTRHRPNQAF